MPEISVITIVRNGSEFIRDAVNSVLKQSFRDFEYIIIDDGSEDDTLEIIKSYNDKRIVALSMPHDYIGNLNYALGMAKGRFIARFDGDDYMHSNRLLIQHIRMTQNLDIDICATWGTTISENNDFIPIYSQFISRYIYNSLVALIKENFVIHGSVMIRKSFLNEKACAYRSEYPYCEDYDLWLQMAEKDAVFYVEPQILVGIRQHSKQVTSKKEEEIKESSHRLKLHALRNILIKNNLLKLADGLDDSFRLSLIGGMNADVFFKFYCDLVMPCFVKNRDVESELFIGK